MAEEIYDVVIIGGGVTGTAVLWVLSRFTNLRRLALVEKYAAVATVNSAPTNNSQTLHFGDIETNYSLEKALPIKDAAELMMAYVLAHPDEHIHALTKKMVLGVGDEEVRALETRFVEFKGDYPNLKLVYGQELAKIEPAVMAGRDPSEPVVALLSEDGYAIDYQKLSQSFLEEAQSSPAEVDTFFSTKVRSIRGHNHRFAVVISDHQVLVAKAVVVASGPFSLLFAQSIGLGLDLGILPVAGSFYFTPPCLRNKVYTVQTPDLPFAAIHGDPDVADSSQTRFGPTAKMLPMLERHQYQSVRGFLRTPLMRLAGLLTLAQIARNRVIANFMFRNFFYDWPLIGRWLFLRKVRKIVPGMPWRDLKLGKDLGGLRPQVVDTKTRTMQAGESKIFGPGIIFNTTPSPGASVSLKGAELDAAYIVGALNALGEDYAFDREAFDACLRPTSTP